MAEDKKTTKTQKKTAPSDKGTTKKQAPSAAKASKPQGKKASKSKGSSKRAPLLERTYFAKPGENAAKWRLIDATGLTVGRLSTYISSALMGKDKPQFTRHSDTGDHVIVINAEKVKFTGKKWTDKWYHYHTGFIGGIKSFTPKDLLGTHPERILERAVYGMIPRHHMGRKWFKKLHVYTGTEHPHEAQKPEKVELPKGHL